MYAIRSYYELNTYNFKKGDTEGVVNYGLSLENIVLAAIFIEDKQENIIKISLRSKGNFSVNDFSRAHFNGVITSYSIHYTKLYDFRGSGDLQLPKTSSKATM